MTSPVRTWAKEEFAGIGFGGKRLSVRAISIKGQCAAMYVADREGEILGMIEKTHPRSCPTDYLVTAKHSRNIREDEEKSEIQGLDPIENVACALAVYDVIIWRLTCLIQVLVELPDSDLGPGTYV